jgi:hypothetical protein
MLDARIPCHVRAMKKYLIVGIFVVAGVAYADHHWTPPQAAFDACAKNKQGDTCSFKGKEDRMVSGTCQVPRAGSGSGSASPSGALVCRPHHHDHGAGSGSGSGH